MLTIQPGRPEDSSIAAELIADTDRALFSFCGGGDLGLWIELSEWEWREERGIYNHAMSHIARRDESVLGLLIGAVLSIVSTVRTATRLSARAEAKAGPVAPVSNDDEDE